MGSPDLFFLHLLNMSNIRGKLRQQYIDNWLEGNEDPDVEVKPTRIDGKYIVRSRLRASDEDGVRARIPPNPSPTNPSPTNTAAETEDQKPKFEEKDISSNAAENNSKDPITEIDSKDPITEIDSKATENNSKDPIGQRPASGFAGVPENDIMEEILKQLKIINDERHAKEIKKAKKKELQQAIRKEFVRHRVIVEDPDPIPTPEPQTVYVDRTPIRMRRRLDLRNKR